MNETRETEKSGGPGLSGLPQDQWPSITPSERFAKPIDRLRPGTELHQKTLDYLLRRLELSEREMSHFYPRWRVMEKKVQSYIDLEDWEKKLKEMNNAGAPPKVISITVPYSFAVIATIVTYLIHTFAGRKPMFQVGSYKKETTQNAHMMELVLQYNADHTRLVRHLFQFLQDGEIYGVGILRNRWKKEKAFRTIWKKQPRFGWLDMFLGNDLVRTREERVVYAGNEVSSIDPFMFFPDPRVPMVEVNRKGEFVFWRDFSGKHTLLAMEAAGELKYVNHAATMPQNKNVGEESARHLLAGGTAHPGLRPATTSALSTDFYQVDQGTVTIIPRELGLGDSSRPEKWIFTILNKSQIAQAEPFQADHDMHPVSVSEPYTLGYGFGNVGIGDYLGPVQDTLSWFLNSHIANVRTALNNMWVVDPSMVEMGDLKNPDAGKIIRLKKAAYGQDVRSVLGQLQVQDVTSTHVHDFELLMRIGDALSSITDNIRGLQDSGGRKTATEVRTSGEAAASRLAAHTRLISAQAMVDLTEQQCLNIQQYMEEPMFVDVVGIQGYETPLHIPDDGMEIRPEMVVGDFHYPINDGTLPIDRVALLDVWKELFLAVNQSPILAQKYDVDEMFRYIAELGGARNIDKFILNVNPVPNAAAAAGAQAGNLVPLGRQSPPTPGTVPAAPRAAGGTPPIG